MVSHYLMSNRRSGRSLLFFGLMKNILINIDFSLEEITTSNCRIVLTHYDELNLRKIDKCSKFLYLYRQNITKQAISLYLALHSNIFYTNNAKNSIETNYYYLSIISTIDFLAIKVLQDKILSLHNKSLSFLEKRKDIFILSYEELCSNYKKSLELSYYFFLSRVKPLNYRKVLFKLNKTNVIYELFIKKYDPIIIK